MGSQVIHSLLRQRGFIYLTTGANGTGKTLFTLKDVRDLQIETGRPVYFCGFTPKQPILDFGWLEFDVTKWQDLPNGAICVVDECQEYMPTRGTGAPPPWIQAIASTHRKRGFDFFLITPHPLNFDSFVRRTIASPGWHRHFKASMLGDSSNELKWTSVVDQPQKANSGASGDVTSRSFPTDVYDWYVSTVKHTAKKGIPRKVWLAIFGCFAAGGMVIGAVYSLVANTKNISVSEASESALIEPEKASNSGPSAPAEAVVVQDGKFTAAQLVASYKPRIAGMPQTAPRYDELTTPKTVPYPAICLRMGSRCECWTEQATRLSTPADICEQIVRNGLFVDFKESRPSPVSASTSHVVGSVQTAPAHAPPSASAISVSASPVEPIPNSYTAALARRNAQVRSVLSDRGD